MASLLGSGVSERISIRAATLAPTPPVARLVVLPKITGHEESQAGITDQPAS
jgi:hypothetical protein